MGTAWAYVDWQDRVEVDAGSVTDPAAARSTAPSASASPSSSSEPAEEPVSLWLGDGYTTGYACPTADRLGWECVVEAAEGVGFVAGDPGERLADRLAAIADSGVEPDVVVVDAGRNDVRLVDGPNLRAAMDTYLDALRETFPDAGLVQVVPWTLAQEGPLTGDLAGIVTEVVEDHDGYAVDPVAAGWAGTGRTDQPDLRSEEGGASPAGNDYVARRLADTLRRLDLTA
ncbi:SGNH/GDSL hydrolase family protein [Nocardioides abyssi]|uniref:SGNH/GDSL hydrolase family protein n=1 Tax=Nocardioides abyssi TaxID=3058370 RepID=A0ABT8EWI2_9ACTN|nr:hypothetical protein [Nocardioides abyssi]MDN4162500.1 hypothetical protein [Nocardioides abyssi]